MRKHLSPAMIISLIALFFALAGGAVGAQRYIITSTTQIKPSVLAQLKGNRGPEGPAGPQGPTGAAGHAAAAGATGATGADGHMGPAGPQGIAGPKGDPGAAGADGATGAQGPKGDPGAKGDISEQGPAGAPGSDAKLGVFDTDGNRLGDYLSGTGSSLTILSPSHGLIYTLNTEAGAYNVPSRRLWWETSDCSGAAYVQTLELPQYPFVLDHTGSGTPGNPGDPMYVASRVPQAITAHSTLDSGSGVCHAYLGGNSWQLDPAYPVHAVGTVPAAAPAPLRIG